jgi:hypothetical protein
MTIQLKLDMEHDEADAAAITHWREKYKKNHGIK